MSVVDKEFFEKLKDMDNLKQKSYAAVVHSDSVFTETDCEILNKVKDLEINQQTPVRVLHRRSQLIREKKVYRLHAELVSANLMVLRVLASSGTYIKEFVHGDLGRTSPSVCDLLGKQADIL